MNMSIQCHGCGGWGHYKSKCPTAWAVMQEQSQTGNVGNKGLGKGGKSLGKGVRGCWKGGKGGKGKGGIAGRCFKSGETGHRKQDCTKVGAIDDENSTDDAPTYLVESVWDIGNVEVKWRTADAETSKEIDLNRGTRQVCLKVRCARAELVAGSWLSGVRKIARTMAESVLFVEWMMRNPHGSAVEVLRSGCAQTFSVSRALQGRQRHVARHDWGYMMNLVTKERMEARGRTWRSYVMDVQFDDVTVDVITLDSGARCDVWPRGRRAGRNSKLLPKKVWSRNCGGEGHTYRVPWTKVCSISWGSNSGFLGPR